MNESLLKALVRLFALVVEPDSQGLSGEARRVIATFLEKEFSRELVKEYLREIDSFIESLGSPHDTLHDEVLRGWIEKLCNRLNTEFEQHQKVWLILQLMEFIGDIGSHADRMLELTHFVAQEFNIDDEEFYSSRDFILATNSEGMPHSPNALMVDGQQENFTKGLKHLYHPKLLGEIHVLRIPSTNTFLVKYFGNTNLFLNSRPLKPGRASILGVGGVIRSPQVEPIYYSRLSSIFFKGIASSNIRIAAEDIEYRHKGSTDGVHRFSFSARSGQLVVVMGGSGVGKSTLLNLLNGNLKPASGSILINGYDIHGEKELLRGVIGFVPQDDLLVEDLTVYENLYFGAKLCFSTWTETQIVKLVNQTLIDFDLTEARDLKVGNPINKYISGGQRKRLNIAMELIREPSILFVDEPTSGLSSFDSERIILLLKRQTLKGKVVIANVHQPSSDIYKLFDKVLVMDHGGRVIFQGNPMDAIVYFKQEGHFLKADESECLCCGNVNTEQILRVVESRVVNEYGKVTRKRKRSAQEWYDMYMENIDPKLRPTTHRTKLPLPENSFSIPSRGKQALLFLQRNILSKLANRQFMSLSLLEAPILALILGFFSKYISGTVGDPNAYLFSENDNIPSFLFMSVVAAMFLGLSISAEEIIRDQKVRQRERFLNLSYFSYINSKVLVMMIFSAIQTLLFVMVGFFVLEIRGEWFSSWLVLFSTAFCANMIGLNISAALTSVVTIYITIPLVMVPLMLMSGVIVSYNKLHSYILHPEYVPRVGDLTVSRWAYEALCVQHFRYNKYNRHLYPLDQQLSSRTFYISFLIPHLQLRLESLERSLTHNDIHTVPQGNFTLLRNELALIKRDAPVEMNMHPDTSHFHPNLITIQTVKDANAYLAELSLILQEQSRVIRREKEHRLELLVKKLGSQEAVVELKRRHHNKALESLVLNKREVEKLVIANNRVVSRFNPAYSLPTSVGGRAHLFAPAKRIGSLTINTIWFNTLVIWIMSGILYLSLWGNVLREINRYLERFRFRRLARRIAQYIPR